jgi:opine dehydrogenase
MIFNAMSVERGDDVRMYVEGFGDCVSKLLLQLDIDRLALGEALGRDLIPIETISDRYRGIADNDGRSLKEKINSRVSTQSAKLPSTFRHRFLAHELRSTFAPMYQVARLLRVNVPTIQAVVTLGQLLIGEDLYDESALAATRFLGLINAKSESLR